MKQKQAKKHFLEWLEDRLDNLKRQEIEGHLESSEESRRYYEKMSQALNEVDHSIFPELQADPLLPARIRAMASQQEKAAAKVPSKVSWQSRIQWAMATVMLVTAVTIGIFLGKGLSGEGLDYSDSEIISAYSQAFSPRGISDNWQYVLQEQGEEAQ